MLLFPASTAVSILAFAASTLAQGLNVGLKQQSESITQNLASLNFDVTNALSAPATITHMSAKLGILGIAILSFDNPFDEFVIPANGTANSGTVPNVTLTEGVLSTVQILLLPALDIIEADVSLSMQQSGVPTNFTLNLV